MGGELFIILQIAMCVLGTVGFAVTMKAPRHTLKYIAFGGLICAGIDGIISLKANAFLSCLIAMLVLSLYCEIVARIIKEPTTVVLMPSTIPLLPGSSIYYAMLYAINGDKNLFTKYASTTLLAGLGIALGAVISSTLVKIFMPLNRR